MVCMCPPTKDASCKLRFNTAQHARISYVNYYLSHAGGSSSSGSTILAPINMYVSPNQKRALYMKIQYRSTHSDFLRSIFHVSCRRVEPLELALREGQLACAAVLIEGGARISERALKAVKLEPATASSTDKRCEQKRLVG